MWTRAAKGQVVLGQNQGLFPQPTEFHFLQVRGKEDELKELANRDTELL